MKVKRTSNRLYKIIIEENAPAYLFLKAKETSWMWHLRLGHVNFQTMKLMLYGLPMLVQPNEVRKGCLMSKQAHKPFPAQSSFIEKGRLEINT